MASPVFYGLHESLQDVISHRLGWSDLREIQVRSYDAVSAGRDTLIIAPTAGGKTEAALIPVIDAILKTGLQGVACLYISPLKALINDQEDRFSAFCVPTGLDLRVWHGDVPRGDRAWTDGEPPHILMITPESLEVLMGERQLARDLSRVRFIIVDELHSFVESERGVHLKVLLDRLAATARSPVQRIGLSATVGNPEQVLDWLLRPGGEKELVSVAQPTREKRFSFHVEEDWSGRVKAVSRLVAARKALVFVNSRGEAEELGRALRGRVRSLFVHHSSLSPQMRREAEESLAGQDSACIICTSTLELGIDIGDLDVVVQVGAPVSVSSFLQRMGRSGRRGSSPYMAFVLPSSLDLLVCAGVIESARKKVVEPLVPMKRPYNVLVQQVLLGLVRHRRVTVRRLLREIGALSVFREFTPGVLPRLLSFLEQEEYCVRDGDFLMPGPRLEDQLLRGQGKDLYSVIQGGGEVRAVTPEGESVGRLDARFLAGRGRESFSLGGKDWTLVKRDDHHDLVVVVPGEGATGRAFWTGGKAGFSAEVCAAVQRVLSRGRTLLPLAPPEEERLSSCIAAFPPLHARGIHVLETRGKRNVDVIVFSFLSREKNALLAHLVRAELGEKTRVRYDDFSLLFPGLGKEGSSDSVMSALRKIQALGVSEMMGMLPPPVPQAWKFGMALPPDLLKEMAALDSWHIEEFIQVFSTLPLYRVQGPPGQFPLT
ncbi:MAG: DEAD/DEAH box helicase [Methanolinea sp.]|nr:DEAD/DEAH box helicase [Methanolinea sp.]